MSTARDGETTRTTVLTYRTLQKRLNVALLHTNNAGFVRILGECIAHLDLWRKDHIDPRGQLRAKSNSQAPRFLQTLDEASELMLHCEYKLGIRQEHLYGRAPVDDDDCRDDCFNALQRTLNELQQSNLSGNLDIASMYPSSLPTNAPSTPPAPSPMRASASPAISSSHVSPASYEEPIARDELQRVFVKQEQLVDEAGIDAPSHLRKDSHVAHQSPPKEQPLDTLPPISSFQPSASLAQIPSSAPYNPILPFPAMHHSSPPTNWAASPQSPYASSMLNGNDQQTVMMSPNVLHPTLSIGPNRAYFSSSFHDGRPSSKPGPSSPES